MTEDEKRVLEKWRRRAKCFQQAYREAADEAFNLRVALAQSTAMLEERIRELEARLN